MAVVPDGETLAQLAVAVLVPVKFMAKALASLGTPAIPATCTVNDLPAPRVFPEH